MVRSCSRAVRLRLDRSCASDGPTLVDFRVVRRLPRALTDTLTAIIGTLIAIIGTLIAIIGTLIAIIGTLIAIIGALVDFRVVRRLPIVAITAPTLSVPITLPIIPINGNR